MPGDESWPDTKQWDDFNTTVGGRLVRTGPIAAVCHGSTYDKQRCDTLRDNWFFPGTHITSSSSPMAYEHSNDSCNPFLEPEAPCEIGGHVIYAVNATSAEDYQAAINFVRERNVRLVIRNTGHDYLGKSTGAHALALWTHHLKSIELISEYRTEHYTGPAVKVGAGVEGGEALLFADAHGLAIVTGNCPNVGIAGGWVHGGGHSLLSSKYGLGADQVLEWEVVTGDGRLLTATPSSNADLFWALAGGGGGTYGAVVSMIVKIYPSTIASMAFMTVPKTEENADAVFEMVGTFLQTLPAIVDAGATAFWILVPSAFMLMPVMAPGTTKQDLDQLLKPTLDKLEDLSLDYQYSSDEHGSYFLAYQSVPQMWNVSDFHPGGRLIPRTLVEKGTPAVVNAVRYIGERTLVAGVSYNLAKPVPDPARVSANPRLREALISLATGLPVNYTSKSEWQATNAMIVHDLLQPIRRIAPDGGAYLSEASIDEPDFQQQFYGGNYDKLLAVKQKYDPDDIFYARTAVGSDRWVEQNDGRLCRRTTGWEHQEL